LYSLERGLIDALAARLERRMAFALSVTGDRLYITLGEAGFEGALVRHALLPARL
jgi:hypothetical protein